ncbi:solute carrier organic anion transporter family member 1C1-like [Protopterus annectens]|uniref:solute carrier organic anion transporter family member 1C1-like n=1 Tax=Protopterus annectens TaxID=7888 RepID=UPI001CFC2CAE|nr:solute carrier organic anion transporter family member 1C1-like [Protopterus annectens]
MAASIKSKDVSKQMVKSCNVMPEKTAVKTACFAPNLKMFIFALSLSYFAKAISASYTKSSLTQIERRFDISTSLTGLIDGSFEIGNLLLVAFVSHFGAKLHRPKVIAAGSFLMAAGTYLMAMPHFLMGCYKYETAKVTTSFNASPAIAMCLFDESQDSISEQADSPLMMQEIGCESDRHAGSRLWIVVLIGNIIRGMGETPIIPLGVSYIDDFAKEENSGFYFGVVHTIALIGPLVGYSLGSLCARLYVDIGFVDLNTVTLDFHDTRWVGTWWLGFLITGTVNLISAIPFLFIPKSLPKEGEENSDTDENCHSMTLLSKISSEPDKGAAEHEPKISDIGKGFFSSLRKLFQSPVFILYLIISVLKFNTFVGMVTYLQKYLEQEFGESISKANFLIGIFHLPAYATGTFVGGIVLKKFKPTLMGAAKFAFAISVVDWLLTAGLFLPHCENAQVAGITTTYKGMKQLSYSEDTLISECNANCSCSVKTWDPVCGPDGMAYVSPCLAGCRSSSETERNQVFHNCSCIDSLRPGPGNFSAVLGQCRREQKCKTMMYAYLTVSLIKSLVYSVAAIPGYMVLVRTIAPEVKSLGLGIHLLITRTLAGILAPLFYGAAIDATCLKWGSRRCGGQGACRMYDITAFRYIYVGLNAGINAISHIPCIIFLIFLSKQFGSANMENVENAEVELALIKETVTRLDDKANHTKTQNSQTEKGSAL